MNCPTPTAIHSDRHEYSVYGITLYSDIPLDLPGRATGGLSEIELRTEQASFFADALRGVVLDQIDGSWYQIGCLHDRSRYARWEGVGEFLVSGDGKRIACRQFDVATMESFQVYLLGQALSFALVMSGFEPLHATVVVVENEGIGFLGESGFGKSSLAACFVGAGYRILTDDLLLVQESAGRVLAYPGPPRIKLYPKHARKVFADAANGIRMNPETEKLIMPLDHNHSCRIPVPIKAIYTLASPREVFRKQATHFDLLSSREGFVALLKNTFNRRILDKDRLQRQLAETARLANALRIQKISYPRVLRQLPSVRDAILSNLDSLRSKAVACGN